LEVGMRKREILNFGFWNADYRLSEMDRIPQFFILSARHLKPVFAESFNPEIQFLSL
jgi:hypothetical protein